MIDLSFYSDLATIWQALIILGVIVFGILGIGFLHLAASALANVETSYWKQSLPLGAATNIATCVAGYFVGEWMVKLMAEQIEPNKLVYIAMGAGITMGIGFLIGMVVYSVFLKGNVIKGSMTSLIETFLRLLYVILLWGITAVVLSIVQIASEKGTGEGMTNGQWALIWIGISFFGLIALVTLAFWITSTFRGATGTR